MVRRYPSSSKPVELERPPAPRSVVNAVKLMYAGAAVSTVSLVLFLAFSSALKPAIRKQYPHWTASQVNHAFESFLAVSIIEAVIGIGLWLLMARANSQGKNWARITATVLFAIDTLLTLVAFSAGPKTPVSLVLPVLTWLIGAGTAWLLWQKENNDFYGSPGKYDPSIDARIKPPSGLK